MRRSSSRLWQGVACASARQLGELLDESRRWVRIPNRRQARDGASAARDVGPDVDGTQHALTLYAYTATGSNQLTTTANSVAANTWVQVEVQYTAAAAGGARVYINGLTRPEWTLAGDYTRSTNLQRLQLWNDGPLTTDFDQVVVAGRTGTTGLPGAPTNVTGTAGNASVNLSWTAPSSNGGSPITGYRITPYIGANAQTPVLTGSAATTFTVRAHNGTAYTFRVAAINVVGTGPDSAPSAADHACRDGDRAGIPTGLSGVAGDRSVALSWTAPASDGGSPITSYRITPFIGANAQTPINTGTAGTSYTVGSLTNGTAYTFTVAATNSVGTGSPSTATPPLTPSVGYSELRFADGFESGDLVAWNGAPGNGTTSVTGAAARQGNYGLRMVNTTGQYSFLVKALSSAIADSSSIFWVKLGSGSGLQMVAQARDTSSSANMWQLYYDWGRGGFVLYPFTNTGSTEIFTGVGTGTPGSWMKVEVQYNATLPAARACYRTG